MLYIIINPYNCCKGVNDLIKCSTQGSLYNIIWVCQYINTSLLYYTVFHGRTNPQIHIFLYTRRKIQDVK